MENEREFTSEMVDNYADKLLIGLSKEENAMVLSEFGQIDKDFQTFESFKDLDKVEPMSWCLDRTIDHLRDDVVVESIPLDDALRNSGRTNDREVEVPKVVE